MYGHSNVRSPSFPQIQCSSSSVKDDKGKVKYFEKTRIVWFQKISIPLPWKVTGNSRGVGGLEVQFPRGVGGEKSNIFPEGPRALSERNLPISHLRFDKSTN